MNLQWRALQSKVSRRVFYLFIISSLIPIILLAVFQITQMSRQLSESSQKQVRQSVKTIGMDLIGRLFHLENQISLIGQAIDSSSEKVNKNQIENLSKLAVGFSSLVWLADKKNTLIKGRLLQLPQNAYALKPGKASLEVIGAEKSQKLGQVVLTYRINENTFLIGEIKNIWTFDIPSKALFWILGPNGELIYRNRDEKIPAKLMDYKRKKDSSVFLWKQNNHFNYVGYWTLFLKQRFQTEGWVVALSEPKESVLSHTKNLYSVIIPVIIFALLLTMLLSQAQIRRLLVPLEKLQSATGRIAKRDFSSPVHVESGDEFEDLGKAFNTMAHQLNKQFKTLSMLAALDKSILEQKSGEAILKIIFDRLKEVIDYEVLILGNFKRDNLLQIDLMIDDIESNHIQHHHTAIDELTFMKFQHEKSIEIDTTQSKAPEFLKDFSFNHHVQLLLIFPILHRKKPRAFIAVGFKDSNLAKTLSNESLEDIFYRASIAFTHSEWEERLYRQAHYDELTGLPNRRLLRQFMSTGLDKANHEKASCVCMFIDLDNFKDVNDALGHIIGDKLLSMVAHRMQSQVRSNGLLARVGGDEFALFLAGFENQEIAYKEAELIAQSILRAFNKHFLLQNMEYYAKASIGITLYPRDAQTSDDLLKYADMSMYQAKKKGKNFYIFFTKEIKTQALKRNDLVQDMYRAMHNDEFLIYLQPKINCLTNVLHGAEVLVRWMHPIKGIILPNEFLPVAEESNLINSIGDYIFKKTCQQLSDWKSKGYDIPRVAVNLSARQFIQKDLAEKMIKTIQSHHLNPNTIELEVTENAFLDSFEMTADILSQLHMAGCRLTLDDFGTGYSSMQYLMNLPLDTLKIDQVFVRQLPEKTKNISIIKAIKTLADSLNMDCVAEGVETKAQSELLAELDCLIQQGFYFNHAIPPDEFEKQYLVQK